MRTFIALEIPDDIRDRIEEAKAKMAMGGVRLVDRNAMHITLQFIGDVGDNEAAAAADAMREIATEPFTVGLCGVSGFPPGYRIVFVKICEGETELAELHKRLRDALERRKVALPQENYAPHLTIARVKPYADRKALAERMAALRDAEFGSFEARAIVLKESDLAQAGPVYTTLYEREL
ncbi:RNA 2',3'-cyclic phosphodiesterase [uncultured archaeon]|nr:RNA 2',3'-cyclic phosphodiesterase [uncultured archaeon]